MEVEFKVWFPKVKRMIRFKEMRLCDEYDRLCFQIRKSDCTEEYQHLAGKSYIPNEEGIITEVKVSSKARDESNKTIRT